MCPLSYHDQYFLFISIILQVERDLPIFCSYSACLRILKHLAECNEIKIKLFLHCRFCSVLYIILDSTKIQNLASHYSNIV